MKTAKNFLFNLIQSISAILFPIITFPYASKILGPEGIGVSSFAENLCRYFMLFAALGIPIYGIREIAKFNNSIECRSKIFSEILVIHFFASFVSVLIYLVIIFTFDKFHNHIDLYLLGAIYIFFNTFSIEWFFNGMNEFKFIALRSIVIRVLFIIGLFLFVKNSNDVFWYFGLNVSVLLLNNLVSLYYSRTHVKFSINNLELNKHLKPLFFIFLSTLAISLYILIDTIILGFIKGDVFVGYYTLVSKLNKVPLTIILALGTVLIPQLTSSVRDNNMILFRSIIIKSTEFVIMLGIPISIGLFFCSKQLIVLFSGIEFLPALKSMQIMSFVSLLIGLSNIYGMQILIPFGEDKKLLISVLSGTVVSLILNFTLIPLFADFGAALTNLISELVVTIITCYYALRVVKLAFPFKNFIFQACCYLPITIINFYINQFTNSDVLHIILIIIIMSLFFLIINLKLLRTPLAVESFNLLKQKLTYEKI